MGTNFPGTGSTTVPAGSKGSARSTTTKMGVAMPPLGHGKEYGQVTASTSAGSSKGSGAGGRAGPSTAATPGKEYRQVSSSK